MFVSEKVAKLTDGKPVDLGIHPETIKDIKLSNSKKRIASLKKKNRKLKTKLLEMELKYKNALLDAAKLCME